MRGKSLRVWLDESRQYAGWLLLSVIFTVFVPAVARLGSVQGGSLTGMQMAFWVNVSAMVALIPMVLLTRNWRRVQMHKRGKTFRMKWKDALAIVLMALAWPFLYSIGYFSAVDHGAATLMTVVGRASVLVYIPLSVYVFAKRCLDRWDVAVMLVSVIAVAVALVGKISVSGSAWLVLAFIFLATLTQGLYTAISEQWKDRYDPLLTVLVLEIAMVILMSAVLYLGNLGLTEEWKDLLHPPSISRLLATLWYPVLIGVAANAVGFWANLAGFQSAADFEDDPSHKVVFLVLRIGLLTFGQILLVALLTTEVVTLSAWIGAAILVVGLVGYRIAKTRW